MPTPTRGARSTSGRRTKTTRSFGLASAEGGDASDLGSLRGWVSRVVTPRPLSEWQATPRVRGRLYQVPPLALDAVVGSRSLTLLRTRARGLKLRRVALVSLYPGSPHTFRIVSHPPHASLCICRHRARPRGKILGIVAYNAYRHAIAARYRFYSYRRREPPASRLTGGAALSSAPCQASGRSAGCEPAQPFVVHFTASESLRGCVTQWASPVSNPPATRVRSRGARARMVSLRTTSLRMGLFIWTR